MTDEATARVIEFAYDDQGSLETISPDTGTTGYSYDAAGNLRTVQYPIGMELTIEADAQDPSRPVRMTVSLDGQT